MSTTESPSNGLTLVSLFAGCGGSSLGYKAAGYDIRLAVEWDRAAAETYRRNFPGATVYGGDIGGLPEAEALDLARVGLGELDVLDGSPPCQGFSTAGKRRFSDGRNRLFEEYVRLLKAFQPRALIMENVSGLAKGKMKLAFAEMTAALKSAGYRVSCRLLNAWWYGVPQDRRRLVWVGIRGDSKPLPSHPSPIRKTPLTVSDAWKNIRPDDQLHVWWAPRDGTKTLAALRATRRQGQRLAGYSVARRLRYDRPAWTVATGGWAVACPGSTWFSHPTEDRGISIREAARLQGFPDSFILPATREGARLIGNSVPPPMAEAIGRHVTGLLDGRR